MAGSSTEQQSSESSIGGESRPYRNWIAIADFQPIVDEEPLRVGGEYHLNRRSGSVRLEAKVPQGINPTILLLDLIIDGNGTGGDWVRVEATFPAEETQYKSVHITDRNGDSVSVDVQEVH